MLQRKIKANRDGSRVEDDPLEKKSSSSSVRLGPCCVLNEPLVSVGLKPLTLLLQSSKPGSLEASFSPNSRCTASVHVHALFYANLKGSYFQVYVFQGN